MGIKSVTHNPNHNPNPKFAEKLSRLNRLLDELRQRELPITSEAFINSQITQFNTLNNTDTKLHKATCRLQNRILSHLEKTSKIVPKDYYKQRWMPIGMASFGITFGAGLGIALGNMALIGIGLPLGLVLGLGIGSQLDKKAREEGRQLLFSPGSTW